MAAYFNRCQALSRLFNADLIDRTATLSNGLRMKVLHPIPPLRPEFKLTLEETALGRTRQLLQSHPRLHIMWSGGIDTTVVLVSFLRVATPDDWATRLSVHYCPRSPKVVVSCPRLSMVQLTHAAHSLIFSIRCLVYAPNLTRG
jgi:hypothetical protein